MQLFRLKNLNFSVVSKVASSLFSIISCSLDSKRIGGGEGVQEEEGTQKWTLKYQ